MLFKANRKMFYKGELKCYRRYKYVQIRVVIDTTIVKRDCNTNKLRIHCFEMAGFTRWGQLTGEET